jgi:hypothetical protein
MGRGGPVKSFRAPLSARFHEMKVRGVPHLEQPDERPPVSNMIGFQYQDSQLLRKGKLSDYPAQECRFLYRVKPFGGDQIRKNRLKGLHLTDDVYFRQAELKGEETEAANRGNAKDRSQSFVVGSEDYRYFSDGLPLSFHADSQALF